MYYKDYLQLDKILDAQHPESMKEGNEPAHDEMLFVIIHQAYELWFKQILFELDYVTSVFGKEKIDDNSEDLNLVRHRLHRIIRILHLLTEQITILDTMTPLDFLEFRNLLVPASGFQSVQFRLMEAKMGLRMKSRYGNQYYKRTNEGGFNPEDYARIEAAEQQPSLLNLINNWLERMPFFGTDDWRNYVPVFPDNPDQLHPFWNDYRNLYANSLNEKEKSNLRDFEEVFLKKSKSEEKVATHNFSAAAMKSALFIMLYRDFPVFQISYQLLDALIEMDNQMANWRHKHIDMVRRMIGLRMGTGNTSGRGYLEGALNKHYIFKDLSGIATFLIERRKIPVLPVELISKLSYKYEGK